MATLQVVLETVLPLLQDADASSAIQISNLTWKHPEERIQFERLQLLTAKKVLYICNVSEDDAASGNAMCEAVKAHLKVNGASSNNSHNIEHPMQNVECLTVSGALEEAAACMLETEASQMEYLQCYGLRETGLTQVLRACASLLSLQSYYTVGPAESRAWSVPKGTTAPMAAGVIHSDFERLFIRAETIAFSDLLRAGSVKRAREMGLLRLEGKDYVCQDGDIFHFLIGQHAKAAK
jgi:ribosome-binding ATPase YchF (GTP1/OBG family)